MRRQQYTVCGDIPLVRRETRLMARKILYGLASVALISGIAYALAMDPRPCGMDDVSSFCGSGARRSALVTGLLIALLLGYVGRALGNHRD